MNTVIAIIGLCAMILGLLLSSQISIGVSVTILGAAIWIGAAVHAAHEELRALFKKAPSP